MPGEEPAQRLFIMHKYLIGITWKAIRTSALRVQSGVCSLVLSSDVAQKGIFIHISVIGKVNPGVSPPHCLQVSGSRDSSGLYSHMARLPPLRLDCFLQSSTIHASFFAPSAPQENRLPRGFGSLPCITDLPESPELPTSPSCIRTDAPLSLMGTVFSGVYQSILTWQVEKKKYHLRRSETLGFHVYLELYVGEGAFVLGITMRGDGLGVKQTVCGPRFACLTSLRT